MSGLALPMCGRGPLIPEAGLPITEAALHRCGLEPGKSGLGEKFIGAGMCTLRAALRRCGFGLPIPGAGLPKCEVGDQESGGGSPRPTAGRSGVARGMRVIVAAGQLQEGGLRGAAREARRQVFGDRRGAPAGRAWRRP